MIGGSRMDSEHDRQMAEIRAELRRSAHLTDALLRRAVKISVQERCAERAHWREIDARFDEKMAQLATAHLLTEEALKNHIAHQSKREITDAAE
jgi:hypothetical protein